LLDKQGNKVWDTAMTLAEPPLKLQQGQDYDLNISVTNRGEQALKHVALSTLMPSGVEIGNAATDTKANNQVGLSHQDVRDDRVLSYFDLAAAETKTVKVKINAAFLGEFYFPAISSEAMYQPAIRARSVELSVKIMKILPEGANRAVEAEAAAEIKPELTN
jgi:uncharacterized protein YfaS (alpha-2-macroglobulin family)